MDNLVSCYILHISNTKSFLTRSSVFPDSISSEDSVLHPHTAHGQTKSSAANQPKKWADEVIEGNEQKTMESYLGDYLGDRGEHKQAKHLADELNEDREGEEETESGWEAQSEGKRTKTRRIYRSLHLASLWEV
jgi:hypothetical protein